MTHVYVDQQSVVVRVIARDLDFGSRDERRARQRAPRGCTLVRVADDTDVVVGDTVYVDDGCVTAVVEPMHSPSAELYHRWLARAGRPQDGQDASLRAAWAAGEDPEDYG